MLNHFDYNSASPPKSYIRGRLGMDEFAVNYPPNGVIPFHGFAMYGMLPFLSKNYYSVRITNILLNWKYYEVSSSFMKAKNSFGLFHTVNIYLLKRIDKVVGFFLWEV